MTKTPSFAWPGGRRAALSITFDDSEPTQVDVGVPMLNDYGIRGSFYVSFRHLHKRVEAWKRASAGGHEIGNHTATHPCSGNFAFARHNALEDLSIEQMERELTGATETIRATLGVTP